MSYNKQYNTRNSGRYNVPGTFIPADPSGGGRGFQNNGQPANSMNAPQMQSAPRPNYKTIYPEVEQNQTNDVPMQQDTEMKNESMESFAGDGEQKPAWMKSKLQGVKKISNKERRRRQNENLRRLLTPKNALMVLNEIMPGEQVANQFKVEQVPANNQYFRPSGFNFRADLTLHGNNYEGFGENKLTARNAAAELAIRDLMIKRMSKMFGEHADAGEPGTENTETPENQEETEEDESIPMIQLASYALHRLFTEWEYSGHKVPPLKPHSTSVSESAPEAAARPAKPRELPANHRSMHPCMLLGHMRPHLEYVELPPEGNKQHNMLFNIVVEVDGHKFYGKAQSKKDARKAAAKAACEAIFNVNFEN